MNTEDEALAAVPMGLPLRPEDEGVEVYNVVTFDPGGTTGWSAFSVHEIAMYDAAYPILANVAYWSAGEFVGTLPRQVDEMVDLCESWEDAEVVCEDFILRQMLPGRDVLDPVRLGFALECYLRPRAVNLQMPALAMGVATDERLKHWGYWNPLAGKPHARDAVRHAVTWMRRRKADLTGLGEELARANLRGV